MSGEANNVVQLLEAGNFDGAKRAAVAALSDDTPPTGQFLAGLSCLLTGDSRSGRRLVTSALKADEGFTVSDFYCQLSRERRTVALRSDPEFDWLALQEAWAAFQTKDFQTARSISEQRLVRSADMTNEGVRARLFEVHAEAGMRVIPRPERWDWLAQTVASERARVGSRPWVNLYGGCIQYRNGNLVAAERSFQAAAAAPYRLSHAALGAFSFKPSMFELGASASSVRPAHLIRTAARSHLVYVFTCDQLYFERFAALVFLSAQVYCKGAGLHFHLINPVNPAFPAAAPLQLASEWEHVGLSAETYEGCHRSYYASARFIRAGQFADWYRQPICLADIDACFRTGAESFRLHKACDVALKIKHDDNHFPWRSIVADFVVFEPTAKSASFFTDVGQYVLKYLERCAGESWWLDQNAIAIAHQSWRGAELKVLNWYAQTGFTSKQPIIAAPNHDALKAKFVDQHMAELLAALNLDAGTAGPRR